MLLGDLVLLTIGDSMTLINVQNEAIRRRPSAAELTPAAQRLFALGEMTGGIAHDFRNILAVIDSGLRLAERNAARPDEVGLFIAAAREGINRGLSLTRQLLSFARKPDELETEVGCWDANQLLRDFTLFMKYAAGPDIRVVLALAPNMRSCRLNQPQFNASILNLIVNARDAMPDGGEIQVSTHSCVSQAAAADVKGGDYVCIRVKDQGTGMPVEIIEHIFDPLFTTKGERGTGLGLPQVARFMRMINGHVTVASEPGHGTTFDLYFPAAEAASNSHNFL